MLKDLVNIFSETFRRYKRVRTFKYQDITLFNQQNNNEQIEVILEDSGYFQYLITKNIFKGSLEIYILDHPSKSQESILEKQDYCFDLAMNVLEYLETHFNGVMNIYDYSILLLSHFTDDDSAGVKLSVDLDVNGVNFCEVEENFNNEPYEKPEEDKPIDLPEKTDKKISLKKTKLPSTPSKC